MADGRPDSIRKANLSKTKIAMLMKKKKKPTGRVSKRPRMFSLRRGSVTGAAWWRRDRRKIYAWSSKKKKKIIKKRHTIPSRVDRDFSSRMLDRASSSRTPYHNVSNTARRLSTASDDTLRGVFRSRHAWVPPPRHPPAGELTPPPTHTHTRPSKDGDACDAAGAVGVRGRGVTEIPDYLGKKPETLGRRKSPLTPPPSTSPATRPLRSRPDAVVDRTPPHIIGVLTRSTTVLITRNLIIFYQFRSRLGRAGLG